MTLHSSLLAAVLIASLHGPDTVEPGRGWHIELSNGLAGWVILTNDSEKTIESFHAKGRCQAAGAEISQDTLAVNATMEGHPALSGADLKTHFQGTVVEPGARLFTQLNLSPQPSGCRWDADIEAVLYGDGSYGGDWHTAQLLEATRDGTIAAVRFWTERLHAGTGDGAAAAAESERLKAIDLKNIMYPGCHNQPIACAFWRGVHHVDSQVEVLGRRKATPEQLDVEIASYMERWQKKIDANAAWRKLDTTFPLPEELSGQAILQARDLDNAPHSAR